MEKYQIINIKNPENGPQVVHPSVWNDLQVLSDMGYMRYEGIEQPQESTEVYPIVEQELIEDIDNKLQELQHISQRPSKQNRVKRKYNRKK